jgi:hypothetical protein
MGITQGVALGLDISRGARQESRIDQQHKFQMEQARANAEHQATMRPLAEQQARLGLSDLESQIEHNKQTRPLTLAEMQASAEHNKALRPIELEQQQHTLSRSKTQATREDELFPLEKGAAALRLDSERENLNHQRETRASARISAEKAARLARVKQQAPLEIERFNRTGRFSEAFLRDSIDTELSPFKVLDPEYSDALTQATALLDPRNTQANPYADAKIFDVASVFLKHDLNNGGTNPETGLPIVNKRIVSTSQAIDAQGKPIKGHMFVELEMRDSEGNTYRSPLTERGTSDPDDPLKAVDFGKFVGKVKATDFFHEALKRNPEGLEWLKGRYEKLNTDPNTSSLKSDETQWAGRPQKTELVHKRFTENPLFGNADEGFQYVSYGDFEWTKGEPGKLKFLESVARENKAVLDKARQLSQDDGPEEAQKYLQSNFVYDPAELYQMQQNGSKKTSDPKSNQTLQNILAGNQQGASKQPEPDPIEQLTSKPNWWLTTEPIPAAAGKTLTPEQFEQRRQFLNQSNTKKQADDAQQAQLARQFVQQGKLNDLSAEEKTRWIQANLRHFTRQERGQIINGEKQ